MFFYERVSITYNTCIIMPTISPFGLDGNNTKSLSPFDIKGKGRTKIFSFQDKHFAVYTPPEYWLKSLNELPQGVPICPCYMMKALLLLNCAFHAPPDYRQDLQKMFFKKIQDIYIIKDLPITKKTQYIHPSPNQVGIILPSKWGYIRKLHMTAKTLHLHPRHSGETKKCHYMTLTP